MIGKTIAAAAAIAVFGVLPCAPAHAEPTDDCPPTMIFICRMLPIAPELDHDIDLTKPPSGDPGAPGSEWSSSEILCQNNCRQPDPAQ